MSRAPEPRRRLAALALLLVLTGTALLRADEWFSDYERGVALLRKGQAAPAAALLERAARRRPDPGENVLTYGTNRLERYHPWLLLAEARLAAGDLGGARDALRESETRGREPSTERARLAAAISAAEPRRPPPSAPATLPPVTVAGGPPAPGPPPPRAAPPATVSAARPSPSAPAVAIARSPTPATAATATPAAPTPPPPATLTAATANLLVVSTPPGAAVYLDDEPLGSTDPASGRLLKSGIAAGRHHVRVSAAGRADAAQDLDLAAGTQVDLQVTLLPPPPPGPSPHGRLYGLLTALAALAVLAALRMRRAHRPATVPLPTVALDTRTPAAATPVVPETALLGTAANDPPTPSPTTEETFGDYRLLRVLGRGGMATVHEAVRGEDHVALKRPLSAWLDDLDFRERFLREAEIGRTLHHPNIVRILDRGAVAGVPWFTMELVAGETLQSLLKRRGALPVRDAVRLAVQVAEALDYAHLKGVVHRDLKPSNIMVLTDGTVKVMDYGIARSRRFDGLTVTGTFLGTPDYAAPETVEGQPSDARADLYSLGVVLFEMLTARKPFVGETPFATLKKVCSEPPPAPSTLRPDIPAAVEEVVLRLLQKSPDARYPTAEDLLLDLRDWLHRGV